MDEFTQIFIVSSASMIFIIIILFALWVHIGISQELKLRNENLRNRIDFLYNLSESLKYELKFQKTVTKTFSDGLEALNKKQKKC